MSLSQTPIRLFAYPTSPFAQKVGCYLKYKKLDFELVGVNPITAAEIGFTGQRRVPVLMIGDEWRLESSELGLWLEELYPEIPLMPADETARAQVLAVDQWISESLIPTIFRRAIEWENPIYSIRNGWKLARAVHDASPLPWYARVLLDLTESLADRTARMQSEFAEHLGGGPFFASQSKPTLADLSAYPVVVSGHLMGMKLVRSLTDDPVLASWSRRVQSFLPNNPLLVPDRLLMRAHI
jgi:glutathione S-transferase